MEPNLIAALDQAQAQADTVQKVPVVAACANALVAEGVPLEVACVLTVEFARVLVLGLRPASGAADE